jgi:uncharacterized protein YbaR (Trm112 family)
MLAALLAQWYRSKVRLTRLKRILSIPADYITLDIGSGDSPFAPADVICEKFPWDDTERTARFQHDRPLVIGDIEDLPFRDKAFDYIYCSHVVEHTLHPARALAELSRVGKRGYIEVPASYLEKTAKSTGAHFWFVQLQAGRLIFTPKTQGILDPEINRFFEQLMDRDPLYSAFHYGRFYSLFNIGLSWEGPIACTVNGDAPSPDAFEKGSVEPAAAPNKGNRQSAYARWLKRWIQARHRRAGKFVLTDLLACPACKAPVKAAGKDALVCSGCVARYPVRHGAPILLKEYAAQPSTPSRAGG